MTDDVLTHDWVAAAERDAATADPGPTPREERQQEALDDARYGDLAAQLLRDRRGR